jgi:hypothetical protein
MEANKSGAYTHLPTLFVINRKSTGLPSHGRGHWFDPSIAHTESPYIAGVHAPNVY